jgi:hypothetical protein
MSTVCCIPGKSRYPIVRTHPYKTPAISIIEKSNGRFDQVIGLVHWISPGQAKETSDSQAVSSLV